MRSNRGSSDRCGLLGLIAALCCAAGPAQGFALNGTAWDPGPNSARSAGDPAPGGATWSIVRAGVRLDARVAEGTPGLMDVEHRLVVQTQDFDILLDAPGREAEILDEVLGVWASQSGFSNLGESIDFGGSIGGSGPFSRVGDIRVAAFELFPTAVLAHAFRPATQDTVAFGGSAGGDIHVDLRRTWVDDPFDTGGNQDTSFDLYTILLHETGHALGLAHSNSPDAVMFADYSGARRTLTSDDIAGIQALYGVPEPDPLLCVALGLGGMAIGRRRTRRDQPS